MSAPEIINPGAASGGIPVGGSGTPGKLAKFTGAGTSIGDSLLSESGTTITSAATAETFGSVQTWTLPSDPTALTLGGVLVLNTQNKRLGINVQPGTLLSVGDGYVAPPSYDGIRLGNTSEALFSSTDSVCGFRAGVTGATVVAGSTTSHDLLLQRGNVTAITLGASGAVAFAGNLTSSAAQTWTLASSTTTALNIQSGLLNLDTTNSRVGVGTASPTDRLTISGGGLAITGNVTGATTAANSLVMDNAGGTSRFYSIGTSVSTFGNYVFFASKSGGSPGAVVACTIDQAAGVLLGSTSTAVFNASTSGQGLKLPATPGNTDSQTLDCYQDGGATAGGLAWTPTIGGLAADWGGVLPVVASAKYSRIGNLVFCSVSLTGAALVAAYGSTTITGPLAAGPTANTAVPVSGGGNNGVGVQAGNTVYLPTIAGSTAEIRLNWFYAV